MQTVRHFQIFLLLYKNTGGYKITTEQFKSINQTFVNSLCVFLDYIGIRLAIQNPFLSAP